MLKYACAERENERGRLPPPSHWPISGARVGAVCGWTVLERGVRCRRNERGECARQRYLSLNKAGSPGGWEALENGEKTKEWVGLTGWTCTEIVRRRNKRKKITRNEFSNHWIFSLFPKSNYKTSFDFAWKNSGTSGTIYFFFLENVGKFGTCKSFRIMLDTLPFSSKDTPHLSKR